MYVSFSYIEPGIRHTYNTYRSRTECQGIYYRIYLGNNKMRHQVDGILSSPLSQGSDSGETPFFVGFSHLRNIVKQR